MLEDPLDNVLNVPDRDRIVKAHGHSLPETERRHFCHKDGCLFSSALKTDLLRHAATHESTESRTKWRCQAMECGKLFTRKDNYLRHQQRAHGEVRSERGQKASKKARDRAVVRIRKLQLSVLA